MLITTSLPYGIIWHYFIWFLRIWFVNSAQEVKAFPWRRGLCHVSTWWSISACPNHVQSMSRSSSSVFALPLCSFYMFNHFPQMISTDFRSLFFVLFGFVCLLILRPLAGRKRTAVRPSAWHTHTHTRTCRPFTPTILGCPVSVEFKEASRNEFWSSITLSICISWVLD